MSWPNSPPTTFHAQEELPEVLLIPRLVFLPESVREKNRQKRRPCKNVRLGSLTAGSNCQVSGEDSFRDTKIGGGGEEGGGGGSEGLSSASSKAI